MTAKQKELFDHITALNVKNKEAGNCFSLTDDVASWNKDYRVFTPQELDKYLLACDVFEMTREIHCYKPCWKGLMSMTVEELQAQESCLYECMKQEQELLEDQRRYEEESAKLENPSNYASNGGLSVSLEQAFNLA